MTGQTDSARPESRLETHKRHTLEEDILAQRIFFEERDDDFIIAFIDADEGLERGSEVETEQILEELEE